MNFRINETSYWADINDVSYGFEPTEQAVRDRLSKYCKITVPEKLEQHVRYCVIHKSTVGGVTRDVYYYPKDKFSKKECENMILDLERLEAVQ